MTKDNIYAFSYLSFPVRLSFARKEDFIVFPVLVDILCRTKKALCFMDGEYDAPISACSCLDCGHGMPWLRKRVRIEQRRAGQFRSRQFLIAQDHLPQKPDPPVANTWKTNPEHLRRQIPGFLVIIDGLPG